MPNGWEGNYDKKMKAYQSLSGASGTVEHIAQYPDDEIAAKLAGACVTVPLTKGMVALIDLEDEYLIRPYSWHVKKDQDDHWYAYRSYREGGKRKQESMHRLIMGAQKGQVVDHKSGDTLDNRRSCNLRFCTNKENVRNARPYTGKKTSKLRGVSFIKNNQRFRAQIMIDGRKINLGNFTSEKEAAIAYDDAAHKLFGEFARLNFPERFNTAA